MARRASSILTRRRSGSGGESRSDRLQKSDRSAGSFSTAHMIASESDMRAFIVAVSSTRGGGPGSARDAGALELVQAGPFEEVHGPGEVVGPAPVHEPDEHGVVA